ncbi:MAG: 50S ribosomal protein L4 [Candidatus Babeliales bacterium]
MKNDEKNKSALCNVDAQFLQLGDTLSAQHNDHVHAICVRVLLQNWRQGTVGCKGRSDVISRSNKKPWKQKGTGRARAGSPRSPLWRGGGVSGGPQMRDRVLTVTKKMKRLVFMQLCQKQIMNERIVMLDWFPYEDKPNTNSLHAKLKQTGLLNKEKLTFFTGFGDLVVLSSLSNIKSVSVVSFDQPNVVDLSRKGYWVFLKKDANEFKDMVSRWI